MRLLRRKAHAPGISTAGRRASGWFGVAILGSNGHRTVDRPGGRVRRSQPHDGGIILSRSPARLGRSSRAGPVVSPEIARAVRGVEPNRHCRIAERPDIYRLHVVRGPLPDRRPVVRDPGGGEHRDRSLRLPGPVLLPQPPDRAELPEIHFELQIGPRSRASCSRTGGVRYTTRGEPRPARPSGTQGWRPLAPVGRPPAVQAAWFRHRGTGGRGSRCGLFGFGVATGGSTSGSVASDPEFRAKDYRGP